MRVVLITALLGMLASGCRDDDGGAADAARRADAAGPTFSITTVDYPDTRVSGGERGDLSVMWTGDLTFPATVIYRPTATGCPPTFNCTSPTAQFNTSENPLIMTEAVWCTTPTPPVTFGYEVVIVGADATESAPFPAPFDCIAP